MSKYPSSKTEARASALLSKTFPIRTAQSRLIDSLPGEVCTETVGVTDLRNPDTGAAIRVYYPASKPVTKIMAWYEGEPKTIMKPVENPPGVKVFRNGLPYFGAAYVWVFVHVFNVPNYLFRFVIYPILYPFLYFSPLNHFHLPCAIRDAPPLPPKKNAKYPLVAWSHGLTGTGDEHGLLAIAMAKRGYVFALPHHSDGSSAYTDLENNTHIPYKKPIFSNYDKSFRQNQVAKRISELNGAVDQVLKHPDLSEFVNSSNLFCGGFSFGGATAGAAASAPGKAKSRFKAAVLIDGWYHIYFPKFNIDVNLPLELHSAGTSPKIPTLFIGSEEFSKQEKLQAATVRVQKLCKPEAEVHVLSGTKHGNFMEAMYWIPSYITARIGMVGDTKEDCFTTYFEYASLVFRFLEKNRKFIDRFESLKVRLCGCVSFIIESTLPSAGYLLRRLGRCPLRENRPLPPNPHLCSSRLPPLLP